MSQHTPPVTRFDDRKEVEECVAMLLEGISLSDVATKHPIISCRYYEVFSVLTVAVSDEHEKRRMQARKKQELT